MINIKLKWVTNNYNPSYGTINNQVLTMIDTYDKKKDNFKITNSFINSLPKGLTQYEYDIELEDMNIIDTIISILTPIMYKPVSIGLDKTELTPNEINGLRTIAKALIKQILKVEVDRLITSNFDDLIIWAIVPTIYDQDKYLKDFLQWSNLLPLKGYQLLSPDPLSRYAIDVYQKRFNDIQDDDIKIYHELYLIKIGREYDEMANNLVNLIGRMRYDKITVLITNNENEKLLYLELAEMWDASIEEFDHKHEVIIKSKV